MTDPPPTTTHTRQSSWQAAGRSAWDTIRRAMLAHRYLAAAAVGVLGFAIILGLQLTINRHRIEGQLTARAEQALANAAYGHVAVEFTGRDALVTAADPGQAAPAGEVVADVPGVRSARAVTGTPPGSGGGATAGAPAPPPLVIAMKGGRITVRGSVPSTAAKESLRTALETLGRAVDDSKVSIDKSLVETTDVSQNWMGRLTNLVTTVPDHDSLVFDFTTRPLTVSGQVATEGEHQAIMDAASTFVPESAEAGDDVEVVKPD